MESMEQFFQQKLALLQQKKALRRVQPNAPISFCSNDYLGLAGDARVIAAGVTALKEQGAGAQASRLVAGDHPVYERLETQLANAKGTEAALVFGSGYLANIGVIPALVSRGDVVLADRLVHACMLDAAILSGAEVLRFTHNSVSHLQQQLESLRGDYQNCLILTETIFSMDGDIAPLSAIAQLVQAHDAWLLTDDAHGLYTNTAPLIENHIQLGTLSKALGSYGGFVAGSAAMREYLINTARSLMFSTGLPPVVAACVSEALTIIKAEPWRAQQALSCARLFCEILGLPAPQSQIVPLVFGENEAALAAQQRLKEHGFHVAAIRPPTVPSGTARLRFAFTAAHTTTEVERLASVIQSTF